MILFSIDANFSNNVITKCCLKWTKHILLKSYPFLLTWYINKKVYNIANPIEALQLDNLRFLTYRAK